MGWVLRGERSVLGEGEDEEGMGGEGGGGGDGDGSGDGKMKKGFLKPWQVALSRVEMGYGSSSSENATVLSVMVLDVRSREYIP